MTIKIEGSAIVRDSASSKWVFSSYEDAAKMADEFRAELTAAPKPVRDAIAAAEAVLDQLAP